MKSTNLKNKPTARKQHHSISSKPANNADSRYDYLMSLNNDWIVSQNNTSDFIRSVN